MIIQRIGAKNAFIPDFVNFSSIYFLLLRVYTSLLFESRCLFLHDAQRPWV
jgi:hypothetical protein